MTVLENVLTGVTFGRNRKTGDKNSFAMQLLSFVGLRDKANLSAKSLNAVERKFLDLARALGTSPTVLLVDELVAGLGRGEAELAAKLLLTLKEKGISLFVVEHDVDFVAELGGHIIVLDHGRKIAEGGREVLSEKSVVDSYLGGTI